MKEKPIVILIIFLVLMIGSGCDRDQTPPVISRHEAKYPDISKKYLYQSVIRLANISGDESFNKLIKDVRKIVIYLPPKEDSTYQINDVRKGMEVDGFEQLLEVRTADAGRVSLWVNETKEKPHYMGLLDATDQDIIFEIDGQLDLKYISALKMADQGSLMNLIN
jgi:hypothetical protein